jgi:hypothetical protein
VNKYNKISINDSINLLDSNLENVNASFCAEFCIEDHSVDKLRATSIACESFKKIFPEGSLFVSTDQYGIEATSNLDRVDGERAFILTDCPLDDDNFGDPNDIDVYRHFFCISSKSARMSTFRSDLIRFTDRMSCGPFRATDATTLFVRMSSRHKKNKVSGLGIALHSKDRSWFNMSGKPYGTISREDGWVQGVLKDLIVQRVLKSNQYLSKEMSKLQWVRLLEGVSDEIIQEESCPAISISKEKNSATFTHLNGEFYHEDCLLLNKCVEDMAISFNKSLCTNLVNYWNILENETLLNEFIEFILKIRDKSEQVEISPVKNQKIDNNSYMPSYNVKIDGKVIGSLQKFQKKNYLDDLDNSIMKVGKISQFITDGQDCKSVAALLQARLS